MNEERPLLLCEERFRVLLLRMQRIEILLVAAIGVSGVHIASLMV